MPLTHTMKKTSICVCCSMVSKYDLRAAKSVLILNLQLNKWVLTNLSELQFTSEYKWKYKYLSHKAVKRM